MGLMPAAKGRKPVICSVSASVPRGGNVREEGPLKRSTRVRCPVWDRGKSSRMLTKRAYSTRLETRTKESNIYASSRVANPWAE